MGATHDWKVYSANKEYVASCKYPSVAAAVITMLGAGSTIRYGHRCVVWTEGKEEQPAAESYDFTTGVCIARLPDWYGKRKGEMTNAVSYLCGSAAAKVE